MRLFFTNILIFLVYFSVSADEPQNYYSTAEGKNAATLKTALYNIVSGHTVLSYDNLWTAFQTTDRRSDGKVWDIYSITTNYVFSNDQCGSYKEEGDCYNREHSFPKSWFNDASPMYTDLFHLYPSDGKVNGMRSNYPFGEVGTTTYQSNNNYSKLGSSNVAGYTGSVVFEPNDELKGDMARTYFYMVTAYESKISGWSSPHLDGTKYPGLTTWTINLFLKWNKQDPVSQKEINRNNAVYSLQGNRNPFIDHPELAEYIWGTLKEMAWHAVSSTHSVLENHVKVQYLNHSIRISNISAPYTYTVTNTSGSLVQRGTGNGESTIYTSVNKGVYLIFIKSDNISEVQKVIVND